ncbi:acyl-CoA synthetase [Stappia sp. ES.058]|uniref:acyl-CoA synthetase n=1 Tax=Stappia sp. ES.058 TaxID=1881061 RepID=UPI000879295E|nr:acyl-CoA synthetase [Stappia sp. ES.058]SDU46838.1 acetyl-CoA synthetase [Stappia sp. ES.058]
MLSDAQTYEELIANFRWQVPAHYNIGVDICDKWAMREPDRPALICISEAGAREEVTFGALMALSNKIANRFATDGVTRGDRVAILLPQAKETAAAHIAAHKLGAISIPLFMLFGEEALAFRLGDSGAKAVVTNATGAAKLAKIRAELPDLERVYTVDGAHAGTTDLHAALTGQADSFTPVDTSANDPAILIYTSGTTGQPKGALHGHRVLLGHLPGVEMSHDLFPQVGDRIWTPADWAWIGGLLDVLMPALHHGVCVVACRFEKFTADAAFRLIAQEKIQNAFLPPTALKMMRAHGDPDPAYDLNMRTIASGGETLGAELLDWGRRVFGVTINEFYGQTECNMIVSSCAAIMPPRPGIMGRAVPGHDVRIVDAAGTPVTDGTEGNIGVRRGDPVMFLRYWNNSRATEGKFAGDFLLTGDMGMRDAHGWIRFVGRDDDVITSSGYRIGPGEIEDCLIGHPAVSMAGVVGKPDPQRTEIVKAYVVLADGFEPTAELARALQDFVKVRLAAHEYPREVVFVDTLPMTTTGKIIRKDLRQRAVEETKGTSRT